MKDKERISSTIASRDFVIEEGEETETKCSGLANFFRGGEGGITRSAVEIRMAILRGTVLVRLGEKKRRTTGDRPHHADSVGRGIPANVHITAKPATISCQKTRTARISREAREPGRLYEKSRR